MKTSEDKIERFGKYQLLRRIAVGGMAEVFLAKAPQPRNVSRRCIIKRILPGLSQKEEFVNALIDEARLGAALSHPNLVTTLDFDEIDGSLFLALEYVDGPDLGALHDALSRNGKRMPVDVACALMIQVLKGLDFAHKAVDENGRSLGVVHRDINPPNILLSKSGAVKVADFGIAHAAVRLTRTGFGQLKGKIPYMSPEQASGKKIDLRSDLWSCGVMLFEILTGGRLFAGANEMEVLKQVREASVLPPSTFRNEVDKELDDICLKALARDPKNRFDSADNFGLAISDYLRKNHPNYQENDLAKLVMSNAGQWEQAQLKKEKTSVMNYGEQIQEKKPSAPVTDKIEIAGQTKAKGWSWFGMGTAVVLLLFSFYYFWPQAAKVNKTPVKTVGPTTQMEIEGGKGGLVLLEGKLLGTAPLSAKISAKRKNVNLAIAQGGMTTFKTGISVKEGEKKFIKVASKVRRATGKVLFTGEIPNNLTIDGEPAQILNSENPHVTVTAGAHRFRWLKDEKIYEKIVNLGHGQKVVFSDEPN